MKSLAVALMLGGTTTSKNLYDVPADIWEETTESYDVCGDPWQRFDDDSNSWSTYKNALKNGDSIYQDSDFGPTMDSVFAKNAKAKDQRKFNKKVKDWKRPKDIYPGK